MKTAIAVALFVALAVSGLAQPYSAQGGNAYMGQGGNTSPLSPNNYSSAAGGTGQATGGGQQSDSLKVIAIFFGKKREVGVLTDRGPRHMTTTEYQQWLDFKRGTPGLGNPFIGTAPWEPLGIPQPCLPGFQRSSDLGPLDLGAIGNKGQVGEHHSIGEREAVGKTSPNATYPSPSERVPQQPIALDISDHNQPSYDAEQSIERDTFLMICVLILAAFQVYHKLKYHRS